MSYFNLGVTMSLREEEQKKACPSRGLGLAAAAIGVGVGAALYYLFSKRTETPDTEGATSQEWTCEHPQAFRERSWSLEECAICFEIMLKDQQLLSLPCTHNFHVQMLALVSVSKCQRTEAIIRNDIDGPHPDGSYRWALQTEGGIFHEQRGSLSLQPGSTGEPALNVEGQYQYTAPDGQIIKLLYKADENGFQPTGAHIPTAPPVPAAIQRALRYLATAPPSYNDYNDK